MCRMYDPETRFLQEDTYWGDAKDPLILNLYTYCKGNPLIYSDPTGHDAGMVDYDATHPETTYPKESENIADIEKEKAEESKSNAEDKLYKETSTNIAEVEKAKAEENKLEAVENKLNAFTKDYFTDWQKEGEIYGFERAGASFINSLTQSHYNSSIYKPKSIYPEIQVEDRVPLTKSSKNKFMIGSICGDALFQASMMYAGAGFDEYMSGFDDIAEIEKVDRYIDLSRSDGG